MIKEIIQSLELPLNRILFLHVRLKGLSETTPYWDQTKTIINYLEEFYQPKTILIPTFTYSFTRSRCYNRVETNSEVGRFSEEARLMYPDNNRTMNPVFSVIDTKSYLKIFRINENTAFGKDSLFDHLSNHGHIIVNINLDKLILTFLHYIEESKKVDYRYNKLFSGFVSSDGIEKEPISYDYFVRDRHRDTERRYDKVESLLLNSGSLFYKELKGVKIRWIDSQRLFDDIGNILDVDQRFTITD